MYKLINNKNYYLIYLIRIINNGLIIFLSNCTNRQYVTNSPLKMKKESTNKSPWKKSVPKADLYC